MNKPNAKQYLSSIPMWTKKKNSLEDIALFLNLLGFEEEKFQVIHVAGTNGKGSVCAFLTSILCDAGYHVGTFISPHLTDIKERILIDGSIVTSSLFECAFERVLHMVQNWKDSHYVHPTFFEFLFLMGMVIFQECRIDYIILETGLGGRYDTTNVIQKPAASVITSVSMDHMEYLGATLQEIASQKAGIIKPEVPVIYDGEDDIVAQVILSEAKEKSAPTYPIHAGDLMTKRRWDGRLEVLYKNVSYIIPFIGRYQAVNGILAVQTIHTLGLAVTKEQMMIGIQKTRWPGRMEEVLPGIYLDGAHNIGGIQAFTKTAGEILSGRGIKPYLLFAAASDKDYSGMIEHLCRELSLNAVVVARVDGDRGLGTEVLESEFRKHTGCPVTGFSHVRDAMDFLVKLKSETGVAFCVGSLYLIGEIKAALRRDNHD